ncbi:putative flap endonuclease 1 homolog isoform X2 [Cetorhinus maximus]
MALDAAVVMNQFRTARPDKRYLQHLSQVIGVFYRTASLLEKGIKPVFVFDGPAPRMKFRVLCKRRGWTPVTKPQGATFKVGVAADPVGIAEESGPECGEALERVSCPTERGANEQVESQPQRLTTTASRDPSPADCRPVYVPRNGRSDCQRLLTLLGVPYIEFVDLCILMGCDYCDKIKGIGLKRALPLIQSHKSIEEIIRNVDRLKYQLPEGWPYREARKLFLQPEVVNTDEVTLEWANLDEEGLVQLLVHEKNAKEKRVRNRIQRLRESLRDVERRSKTFTVERQTRLDEFYTKVKAFRYKKQGDESYFRTTMKRRKAVKRNLSKVPLRRCVRVSLPRSKPAVPSTDCEPAMPTLPVEPQNIPESLQAI